MVRLTLPLQFMDFDFTQAEMPFLRQRIAYSILAKEVNGLEGAV